VTCTTCGASLESTSTTCPVCGTDVAPPEGGPGPDPAGVGAGANAGYGPPGGHPAVWSPAPGGGQAGWTPPPAHPSGLSGEVRNWGLAAHLSAYLGAWLLVAFVGPLTVWLLKRDDHPFIAHHAQEALNFNLSFLLYGVVGVIIAVPVGLLTLGIGLIPLAIVGLVLVGAWVILPIVAAVKAANGEGYRYPLTIRFVR
jgi:uncharacterized protein